MIGLSYSIIQLITFAFLGIILFTFSLIVGLLLFNIKLNNNIKSYFINSFLGILFIISIYSFFNVGYKTINLLPFIFLLYLCYKNKERFVWKNFSLRACLPILYIFPIVFILYCYYNVPVSIENDIRFYSKITYALGHFHQENVYHFYNSYNSSFNGLMPYHYTEFWLASIFNTLYSVKSIIALKYIAYPFLISAIAYGIIGFVNGNKLLVFILFIALSLIPLYKFSFINTGFVINTDFWLRPNFIIYYYSLLPLFYLIHEKKWTLFFLIGAIISSISVIILPCLLSAMFFLSLVLFYKKEITKTEFINYIFILGLSVFVMIIIYSVFGPKVNLFSQRSFIEILSSSLSIWKALIFTLCSLLLQSGILLLISFFINKCFIKEAINYFIFLFIGFQLIIGITVFQLVNQLDNSYQFPYYGYAATGFILIITLLNFINSVVNKNLRYFSIMALAFFCVYISSPLFNFKFNESLETINLTESKLSKKWIVRVENYLKDNPQAKGGFVLSEKDLVDISPKSRESLTNQLGSFMAYYTDDCNLKSLTCIDTLMFDKTKDNKKNYEKLISWIKIFPQYTNQSDVESILKRGEIDYFICTKEKIINDTSLVIIQDVNSSYCFVCKN